MFDYGIFQDPQNEITFVREQSQDVQVRARSLTNYIRVILIYAIIQEILTISDIMIEIKHLTPLQPLALLQYATFTNYIWQMLKDLNQLGLGHFPDDRNRARIGQIFSEQGSVKLFHIFEIVNDNHRDLYKYNKLIFFINNIIANIAFFKGWDIQTWYIITQVILFWLLTAFVILIITLLCIFVPLCLLCYKFQLRRIEARRQNKIQRIFQRVKKFGQQQSFQPCYICLDEYKPEDDIIILECNANHIFHIECLKPWMEKNEVCPVCRAEIN